MDGNINNNNIPVCIPNDYTNNPGGRLRCLIGELKSSKLNNKTILLNILDLLTYPYSEIHPDYILSDGTHATPVPKLQANATPVTELQANATPVTELQADATPPKFLLTKNINNDIITYTFDDKEGQNKREEERNIKRREEEEEEEDEEVIIKKNEIKEGKTEEQRKSSEEQRKRSREEAAEGKRKNFEKIETERKILYKISENKLVSKTKYDNLKQRYNLSTCKTREPPKNWIIPDKQFQPLIDQMKIANNGSFTPDQENAIKQHKLERTNCLYNNSAVKYMSTSWKNMPWKRGGIKTIKYKKGKKGKSKKHKKNNKPKKHKSKRRKYK
jgi:hypothetical protein